ncbi:hypothetical protein ACQP2F_33530 [Actinoplanes sp. CA-030573]|uniref:hypothetical protein n=1 Tax=Actinoplanes sp. CA-030573 TaxID=3239898 RepID=UPI003D8C7F10
MRPLRPVPYRLYRAARKLLLRAVINLVSAAAAAAIIGVLLPRPQPDSGDKSTTLKIIEFITSGLLWIIATTSMLVLVGVAVLQAYASIAGVAPPGAGRDRNNPL